MREIKFRVFDKDTKKMHVCGEDVHDSITFIYNQACYYNLQNGCGSLPNGKGTYVLMQYSGLIDKNGKEIYEGDIIEYSTPLSDIVRRGTVVYTNRAEWGVDLYLLNRVSHRAKIIGNIYEDSHLLEGKQ